MFVYSWHVGHHTNTFLVLVKRGKLSVVELDNNFSRVDIFKILSRFAEEGQTTYKFVFLILKIYYYFDFAFEVETA